MRYLAFLAFAACGSPAARAPISPDGAAVIAEMFHTYSTARSYSDHGKLVTSSVMGGATTSNEIAFETQFVRGGRFRFEFSTAKNRYELWSDGAHTYLKASFLDHIIDFGANLAAAFDAQLSPSLASDVPELLLASSFTLDKIAITPAASDWHVVGVDASANQVELWIDRTTHVLHRLKRHRRFEGTASRPAAADVTTETTFDAKVDHPIAEISAPALDLPVEPDGPPTWIGIMTDPASTQIKQVVPGAPAEKAGLKAGDEVVSIDGHPVANGHEVVETAHKLRAKTATPIVIKRAGKQMPMVVTAEPRPDAAAVQAKYVDKPAPAFSVPTVDGKAKIDLASLAGHVVVIDFWATWCKPCAITTPHLDDLAKLHPELRVVGISDEDAADVREFLAKHPVSFAQALDAGDATRDYLIQALPTLYVIDKAGVVRYTAVGVPEFEPLDRVIGKLL